MVHNAAIVAATAPDVYRVLTDFYGIANHSFNWVAVCLCYALHFYHLVDYWRSFHPDDWLHHVLMIFIALPIGTLVPAKSLMGFSLFFTTGLPGGLNYLFLFAERNGWISKATEKNLNRPIHVWLRGPGCVTLGALALVYTLSTPSLAWQSRLLCLIPSILNYWNGIYFTEQIIEADVRHRLAV